MGNNQSRLSDSVDRKHTFIRRLGSGGFGTVSAVRNNASGKVIFFRYPSAENSRLILGEGSCAERYILGSVSSMPRPKKFRCLKASDIQILSSFLGGRTSPISEH
jgi:hypothetical protein